MLWRGLQLAVGDIADDTHCEGRIDRENFLGIDADLTLAGDDRPVDLVVVCRVLISATFGTSFDWYWIGRFSAQPMIVPGGTRG